MIDAIQTEKSGRERTMLSSRSRRRLSSVMSTPGKADHGSRFFCHAARTLRNFVYSKTLETNRGQGRSRAPGGLGRRPSLEGARTTSRRSGTTGRPSTWASRRTPSEPARSRARSLAVVRSSQGTISLARPGRDHHRTTGATRYQEDPGSTLCSPTGSARHRGDRKPGQPQQAGRQSLLPALPGATPDLVFNRVTCTQQERRASDSGSALAGHSDRDISLFVGQPHLARTSLSRYDHLLVWNPAIAEPTSRVLPSHRRGAGHRYRHTAVRPPLRLGNRVDSRVLCQQVGADPKRPIVLYTTGMANHMPAEDSLVENLADDLRDSPATHECQLLVRGLSQKTHRPLRLAQTNRPDILFQQVPWSPEG